MYFVSITKAQWAAIEIALEAMIRKYEEFSHKIPDCNKETNEMLDAFRSAYEVMESLKENHYD